MLMLEYLCAKKNRCKYGEKCPFKLHPLIYFKCFERGAIMCRKEKSYTKTKSKPI